MNSIEKLAQMFKERDNQIYLGPQIGKVIAPLPNIKVALGDRIILGKDKLIISGHIYSHYPNQTGTAYLNSNDEVILLPSNDEQKYFLLDKAVKL